MKLHLSLICSIAATSLLLTSCGDKKGEDSKGGGSGAVVTEKDALERLKKDAAEVKALKKEGDAAKDQAEQMQAMKKVLAKAVSIKTEGLPADLKTDLAAMQVKMAEMAALIKDIPSKKEDMEAWGAKNPDFGTKMQKIGEEGAAADKKLKETAKKYDVDLGD
jgi:hypothetical protein